MSGSDCQHWEARRKERVLERQREASRDRSQQRKISSSENAQRPGTAETAAQCNPEDGVQRHEGKKISPAKLQRRLSDLDYDMQW